MGGALRMRRARRPTCLLPPRPPQVLPETPAPTPPGTGPRRSPQHGPPGHAPPGCAARPPPRAALVRQWVAFAEGDLATAAAIALGGPPEARARGLQELRRGLGALEAHLSGRSFLVGDGVTLADVTVACALLAPFTQVLDAPSRAPFPAVTRWFLGCVRLPEFRAELGDVRLCGGGDPTPAPPGTPGEQPQGVSRGPGPGGLGQAEPPPAKSAAQLKKEAKKREKLEKFQQKQEKNRELQAQAQAKAKPSRARRELQGLRYETPTPPGCKKGMGGFGVPKTPLKPSRDPKNPP
ncbi:valine--tRNA ligase [Corvus hawaiiensis]|uniref:valine--tRNA ligase n=1 Tax=Corvus hawaiiensis TaxID=134902 RepID=UPI00201889E9|nr:valine--tRNA ligase [Corvus hawaiiensis]